MKNTQRAFVALTMTLLALSSFAACSNVQEPIAQNDAETIAVNSVSDTKKSSEAEKNENTAETDKQFAQLDENVSQNTSINANQIDENMPSPFGESPDAGTDANADFYQPCNRVLDNIPVELMRLRNDSDVNEWIASFPSISIAPNSINEYANIYSFITRFNISKEEAETALAVYLSSDDEQIRISREQFDMIFSGDVAAITKTFASDFSIVIGEFIYCPNWIYTHTSTDYAAVGISTDILAEKASAYSNFNLTDSARAAFSAKLSEYTGEMINIEPVESDANYQNNISADNEFFDEGVEVDEEFIEIVEEVE